MTTQHNFRDGDKGGSSAIGIACVYQQEHDMKGVVHSFYYTPVCGSSFAAVRALALLRSEPSHLCIGIEV